jgi:endonuclease III
MATKAQRVAQLLLKNRRYEDGFWPGLSKGKPASLKNANKFLLGCIIDYQVDADEAWENARRFAEDILGNPDNLWHCITSVSLPEWESKRREYGLHRFPKAHERVWRIGRDIVAHYEGDARKIWKGQPPDVVLVRLNQMRVGEQISRMIVGALCDTDQIQGSGDIKVDIHVRRVLGRVFRGDPFTSSEAPIVLETTRQMWPENPWLLDEPLYSLGKDVCCASNPECGYCYLHRECTFYKTT